MRQNVIKEKSFSFALRVVNMYQFLTNEKKEYVISKQLLRSGTAIGALVCEAEQAESKADFIHKLSVALKEANETEYWIELLHQSNFIEDTAFLSVSSNLTELLKLLISIIKSSKSNG